MKNVERTSVNVRNIPSTSATYCVALNFNYLRRGIVRGSLEKNYQPMNLPVMPSMFARINSALKYVAVQFQTRHGSAVDCFCGL